MKIIFNSKEIEVKDNSNLEEALSQAGIDGSGVATAVNGEVIAAGSRKDKILKAGDNILLITAYYGG